MIPRISAVQVVQLLSSPALPGNASLLAGSVSGGWLAATDRRASPLTGLIMLSGPQNRLTG